MENYKSQKKEVYLRNNVLNTDEIYYLMRGDKQFNGVFSANEIIPNMCGSFIINTHTKNLPGQHWIALLIDETFNAYIFDSLATTPQFDLMRQLSLFCFSINYNTVSTQKFSDNDCGWQAVYFLKKSLFKSFKI